jgi:hypothetical protein
LCQWLAVGAGLSQARLRLADEGGGGGGGGGNWRSEPALCAGSALLLVVSVDSV